jgi:hypothetical protein
MFDYALVGTCGDSRSERKTTATAHSPIERLRETGAAECQPLFSRASARTRRSIMDRDLANWNLGMADAESASLAASGRSRDYYDGYDYACALNYEYTGARPECVGEEDLGHIGNASVVLAPSPFSTQLSTLRSLRLCGKHCFPALPNRYANVYIHEGPGPHQASGSRRMASCEDAGQPSPVQTPGETGPRHHSWA